MAQLLGGVDVGAVAAGVAGIGGIVGLAIAGAREGLKRIRGDSADVGAKITGGVIMDNLSMTMLSDRLRDNTEATRENTIAQHETAHQIERLRDRMP